MKILIVDDDDLIRWILVEILTANGYTDIAEANSGEAALHIIASSDEVFDCFMFDIQMPGMDGIELCRKVKQMAAYSETPVIMITAMKSGDYVERAFREGATDYVTKPFDNTELVSRVRLADKLQAETRRANSVLASAGAKSKPAYSAPVQIDEISGFVGTSTLENYVKILVEQSSFSLAAVAIRVPELQTVHAGSDFNEYRYVVMDVAEVISDAFVGAQAFMSYIGSGIFLCVGNRFNMRDEEALEGELLVNLNNPRLVCSMDVETDFSVIVGARSTRKVMERRRDLSFLQRAIDNLKTAELDRPHGGSALSADSAASFAA